MKFDEYEELFDSPGYDEVVKYGKRLFRKVSKDKRTILSVHEYRNRRYAMLWDAKDGRNISYKTLDDMIEAHPKWNILKQFEEERK